MNKKRRRELYTALALLFGFVAMLVLIGWLT
jgi:hypothetical protein